jgi:hypothetical protein
VTQTYGAPGYGAPWPAPPQRPAWPIITAGAIAIVVVIAATVAYAVYATRQVDDTPTAGIGTWVQDGEFEFAVTGIDEPVSTIGTNPYMERTAQGVFRTVHVTIANVGDKAATFIGHDQQLIDNQGNQYSNDTAAEMGLENASLVLPSQINPGNQISVSLVYDVPTGTVPAYMNMHVAMRSPGAKVSLSSHQ